MPLESGLVALTPGLIQLRSSLSGTDDDIQGPRTLKTEDNGTGCQRHMDVNFEFSLSF